MRRSGRDADMRDVLASPLFDAALRGAIVLLVALVLTVLLHRRSAATRHAIWAGAIAAQILLLALAVWGPRWRVRSEEHTSELQSHSDLVCRLLLEKKKNK